MSHQTEPSERDILDWLEFYLARAVVFIFALHTAINVAIHLYNDIVRRAWP